MSFGAGTLALPDTSRSRWTSPSSRQRLPNSRAETPARSVPATSGRTRFVPPDAGDDNNVRGKVTCGASSRSCYQAHAWGVSPPGPDQISSSRRMISSDREISNERRLPVSCSAVRGPMMAAVTDLGIESLVPAFDE
jgi:hypothetical protein